MLALTSQSLGLVIAVIPYIRHGISQMLTQKQQGMLTDFDRILGVQSITNNFRIIEIIKMRFT